MLCYVTFLSTGQKWETLRKINFFENLLNTGSETGSDQSGSDPRIRIRIQNGSEIRIGSMDPHISTILFPLRGIQGKKNQLPPPGEFFFRKNDFNFGKVSHSFTPLRNAYFLTLLPLPQIFRFLPRMRVDDHVCFVPSLAKGNYGYINSILGVLLHRSPYTRSN